MFALAALPGDFVAALAKRVAVRMQRQQTGPWTIADRRVEHPRGQANTAWDRVADTLATDGTGDEGDALDADIVFGKFLGELQGRHHRSALVLIHGGTLVAVVGLHNQVAAPSLCI